MSICFYQSISLTNSATADVIVGTAGNDTITGAAGTIGTTDVIVDSSTSDSDVANLNVTGVIGSGIAIAKVETINLGFGFGGSLDLTNVSQANTINLSSGVAGSETATLVAVGTANGNNLVGDATIKTIDLAGTAASNDSISLTTKASALALTLGTANAIETVALKTSGTASTVTVTNTNKPTTIAASGDANLKIVEAAGGGLAGITVTNAMTGSATLTLKSIATTAQDYSGLASTAILELSGAINGAETVNNTQSSVKLSGAANTGGIIAAKSGTLNTLNLAVAANQTNDVEATGFSVINLTHALSTATDTLTLAKGITATGATLNVSGAGNIVLNSGTDYGSVAKVVATNATGNLTVVMDSTALPNFTGGSGADSITTATGAVVTVDGGAGTDTLSVIGDATGITFSNIDVVSMTGAGADLAAKSSQFNGKTLSLTGTNVGNNLKIVTAGMDSTTLDMTNVTVNTVGLTDAQVVIVDLTSGSTIASAVTITGTNAGDAITGGSAADTISGGAGADVIVGGAGADSITAGEGADVITGGAGNDAISFTETISAIDKFVFSGGAATNALTFAANGTDTITGWRSTDTINVAALGDGTTGAGATAITSAGTIAAITDDRSIVIDTTGAAGNLTTGGSKVITDWTNLTQVAEYLSERFSHTTGTADEEQVFVINNTTAGANKTYIYNFDSLATANTTIDALELSLVGVIDNGGSKLVDANVVYA